MALRENLIKFMKNKGFTIKELASKTEISEPTLKRLRTNDDANPTLDVLIKISTALEVPIGNLIAEAESNPVFFMDKPIHLPKGIVEFTIIFTRDIFSFVKGNKAVFKKYNEAGSITKYILNKDGIIFEKINSENLLFRDEHFNNYSVTKDFILACIVKELYEVHYV